MRSGWPGASWDFFCPKGRKTPRASARPLPHAASRRLDSKPGPWISVRQPAHGARYGRFQVLRHRPRGLVGLAALDRVDHVHVLLDAWSPRAGPQHGHQPGQSRRLVHQRPDHGHRPGVAAGCGDEAVELQRLLHLVEARIGQAALDLDGFAHEGDLVRRSAPGRLRAQRRLDDAPHLEDLDHVLESDGPDHVALAREHEQETVVHQQPESLADRRLGHAVALGSKGRRSDPLARRRPAALHRHVVRIHRECSV